MSPTGMIGPDCCAAVNAVDNQFSAFVCVHFILSTHHDRASEEALVIPAIGDKVERYRNRTL